MFSHVTPARLSTAILIALLAFPLPGSSIRIVDTPVSSRAEAGHLAPAQQPAEVLPHTSLLPVLDIRGGSLVQRARLDLAVSRFRDAGLALPDLVIVFAATDDACQGHYGLYENLRPNPRITFCSEQDFVYEHELAHAWEAHSATDDQRTEFMDLRGFAVWADSDVAWGERGIEGAAFTIQQAVGGLPLPHIRTDAFWERAAAYEALTGMLDPRLVTEQSLATSEPPH